MKDKLFSRTPSSDSELLATISKRDSNLELAHEAFNEFYNRNKEFVHWITQRIMRTFYGQIDTTDLVLIIFGEVYESASSYDPEKGSVKVWLNKIAQRLIIKWYRASFFYMPLNTLQTEPWEETFIESKEESSKVQLIKDALAELTDNEKIVILATFQYHQPDKQHQRLSSKVTTNLAAICRVQKATIRKIRQRGLEKIQEYILKNNPEKGKKKSRKSQQLHTFFLELWDTLRKNCLIPTSDEFIQIAESQLEKIDIKIPGGLHNEKILFDIINSESSSLINGYRGKIHLYNKNRNPESFTWGSFYVSNKRRSGRTRPLHPHSCPFCGIVQDPTDKRPMNEIRFGNSDNEVYYIIENHNPIIDNQRLIFPKPDSSTKRFRNDRVNIEQIDINLMFEVVKNGFKNLKTYPYRDHQILPNLVLNQSVNNSTTWGFYVNPLPGSGRSEPHLHLNCIPIENIPILKVISTSWQVCKAFEGKVTISRLKSNWFYGLIIKGEDEQKIGETLSKFHEYMNEWQMPYNLLIFPEADAKKNTTIIRTIVIPRNQEYCEAADQKIGGLELLTGVLIPGESRENTMDTLKRNQAFKQATLNADDQLKLERLLRNVFEMPPKGKGVYPHFLDSESIYMPKIEKNRFAGKKHPYSHFWVRKQMNENPISTLESDSILVRITRASICQSDRRVLLGTKRNTLEKQWVLGHEGGGYIVDPGPYDEKLKAGTKVVVLPHLTCGHCDFCLSYNQNLCPKMKHLGFHLNGSLVQLMSYPFQCILPVGEDFPDDALPLVEPLACVLRALFRIKNKMRWLAGLFTVYGAGPMGCLAALAAKRFWPKIRVRIVEPIELRRKVVQGLKIADEVVERTKQVNKNHISFIASSKLQASFDAIDATIKGGVIVLFSGINTDEFMYNAQRRTAYGQFLENIHREERIVTDIGPFSKQHVLVGSSGYNYDDILRSINELSTHYETIYKKVQNAYIKDLDSSDVIFEQSDPSLQETKQFHNSIEALLAPNGVEDSENGEAIAATIKILIKI